MREKLVILFTSAIKGTYYSIDNPVAVVDKVVDKRGTRQVAEAFVQFLYTPEAQRQFAKVGFRPVNTTALKENQKQFPPINKLYTVKDFGGWDAIQKKFFDDKAIFDQIQGGKF
jgi:sulfate/thiosulfate transport system substrate-binding protein